MDSGCGHRIELRLLAHMSQDPVLLDAFRSGEDIHPRTGTSVATLESGRAARGTASSAGETDRGQVVREFLRAAVSRAVAELG